MEFNDLETVCLYQTRYVNIIILNNREDLSDLQIISTSKLALNHEECKNFLYIKSSKIRSLKLVGEFERDVNVIESIMTLNFKFFINLNEIIFYKTVLTNEDLLEIANNCCQLTSLHIIKCFCRHFCSLKPGINLYVEHLQQMHQLQHLKIEPEKPPGSESFLPLNQLQQLLGNRMKLNSLLLNNFTIDCEEQNADIDDIPDNLWDLETLNIGIITQKFWCLFTDYLKFCPHLRELTIHLNDCSIIINVKIINILSKYCKNLCVLHLINCQINLENFCQLKGLLELTLNSCGGVTFANLQQILGGLNLKHLSLINTNISGVSSHIYISKNLKSITIDSIHFSEISEIFQKSLNSFGNLLTLDWRKGYINHSWIVEKCPRLEYLKIPNPYFLGRIVESIKNLKELSIISCNGLSWSLLKGIIMNSTLKRLELLEYSFTINDKRIPPKSFQVNSTLELITLPYTMFLFSLKHWLDLLDMNKHLRIVIFGKPKEILSIRMLILLLKEECIQKRWKNMKICGFTLDLEDFQQNTIIREFVKLHINTNHYKSKKLQFTLEL